MTFRVGQKVVCIDAVGTHRGSNLTLGEVYTVSNVHVILGNEGVSLVETRPFSDWYVGFLASRFRPVVERKTDISIFTAMLNRQEIDA